MHSILIKSRMIQGENAFWILRELSFEHHNDIIKLLHRWGPVLITEYESTGSVIYRRSNGRIRVMTYLLIIHLYETVQRYDICVPTLVSCIQMVFLRYMFSVRMEY